MPDYICIFFVRRHLARITSKLLPFIVSGPKSQGSNNNLWRDEETVMENALRHFPLTEADYTYRLLCNLYSEGLSKPECVSSQSSRRNHSRLSLLY